MGIFSWFKKKEETPADNGYVEMATDPVKEQSVLKEAKENLKSGAYQETFAICNQITRGTATPASKEQAYIIKGLALKGFGKPEVAISAYEKALEINPKRVETLSHMGTAYKLMGKYAKAVQYYDKALEIEPRNLLLIVNKAMAMAETKDKKQALELINLALRLAPGDSRIMAYKAKILDNARSEM